MLERLELKKSNTKTSIYLFIWVTAVTIGVILFLLKLNQFRISNKYICGTQFWIFLGVYLFTLMVHSCFQLEIVNKVRGSASLREFREFEFKVVIGTHIPIMAINTVGLLILGRIKTSINDSLSDRDLECARNNEYKSFIIFCYLFYGFGIIFHTVSVLLRMILVVLKRSSRNENAIEEEIREND